MDVSCWFLWKNHQIVESGDGEDFLGLEAGLLCFKLSDFALKIKINYYCLLLFAREYSRSSLPFGFRVLLHCNCVFQVAFITYA